MLTFKALCFICMLPLCVICVLVSNLCRFCHQIFSILPKMIGFYWFILLLKGKVIMFLV